MNPPPPMFPAPGYVTASAKAVATAASTAFPPRARIDAPTSEAGAELLITIPRLDTVTLVSNEVGCWALSEPAVARQSRIPGVERPSRMARRWCIRDSLQVEAAEHEGTQRTEQARMAREP